MYSSVFVPAGVKYLLHDVMLLFLYLVYSELLFKVGVDDFAV